MFSTTQRQDDVSVPRQILSTTRDILSLSTTDDASLPGDFYGELHRDNNDGMPNRNGYYVKADQKLVGDFYGELHRDNQNYFPPHNKWFPKANKKVVGDFYGELNTQKELKMTKPTTATQPVTPAPAVVPQAQQEEQLVRPEVAMMENQREMEVLLQKMEQLREQSVAMAESLRVVAAEERQA